MKNSIFFSLAPDVRQRHERFGSAVYQKEVVVLNYQGVCAIAERYNEKYFKGTSKGIIVLSSLNQLKEEINKANHNGSTLIGFFVPHCKSSPEAHPISLIYDIKNKTLYASDSIAVHHLQKGLVDICKEASLQLNVNVYSRQAGNGICRTEALIYLKNVLLMKSNLSEVITILRDETRSEHFKAYPVSAHVRLFLDAHPQVGVFLELPDMLKTVQVSTTIEENSVKGNTVLESTKNNISFDEKQEKDHRCVKYTKLPLGLPGEELLPDVTFFRERGYLDRKGKEQQEFLLKKEAVKLGTL